MQAEQFVAGADDAVEAGLVEAEAFEEVLLLGLGRAATSLSIGRDDDGRAPSAWRRAFDAFGEGVAGGGRPSSTLQT
jgi:hypothetical protein